MKKSIIISAMLIMGSLILSSCGGGSKEFTANLENGNKVYENACIACHLKGVAGAAKLTDKERWMESAQKGKDTLFMHVKEGYSGDYGVMPEKGECKECSDQDIYDGLSYILKETGVAEVADNATKKANE